jgi:phosphoserine phosphatase RsbU/P
VQGDQAAASRVSAKTSAGLLDDLRKHLEAARSVAEAAAALAAVVVPALADWCAVDIVDAGASVVLDATTGRLVPIGPLPSTPVGPLSRVLVTTGPSADVNAHAAPQAGPSVIDARHVTRLEAAHVISHSVVPLQTQDRVLGALTVGQTTGNQPLRVQDIVLARMLAHRTALTVQHLRLYEHAHAVSTHLQRSLLPLLPQPDGLSLAARYVPAQQDEQVGGDWYDVFVLPDGTCALTVGDVVGHDMTAAAEMAQIRNLLRGCAWHGTAAPSDVLSRLDDVVLGLQVTSWATGVYGRLEAAGAGHVLRWSNAGHPPPLLLPAGGPARLLHRPIDAPIGLSRISRTENDEAVPAGTTVLLYTDGLVERRAEDIDVGLQRLVDVVTGLGALPLEQWCDALLDRMAPSRQEDDLVLLAVRTPAPQ